jgi:hypothetical protein
MNTNNMTTELIQLSQQAHASILTGDFVNARLKCGQIVKRTGEFLN